MKVTEAHTVAQDIKQLGGSSALLLGSDAMKFKLPPRDYLLKRLPHDRIKEKLQKYGFPQYCKQCYSKDFITLQWSDYLPEQRRTYLHECTQCGNQWFEEVDRYVWDEEQGKYVKNNKYKLD
ncbi:hypothetical protein BU039_00180 [Staphylococcus simulans]|nr:hypothetical protein BU039_00180 [Staphylococcus simulans]